MRRSLGLPHALGLMRPPIPRELAAATLLVAAACSMQDHNPPKAIAWQAAGMSNILDWSGESIPARRIEVMWGSQRDTIVGVLDPPLILVGDTVLLGVRGESASDGRYLFSFGSRRGKLHDFPFPAEIVYNFHDVAISPDGRYWLYLAYDSTQHSEYLAVREWPLGEVVIRSGPVPMCECDVDRHHAHWVTADSFELATLVDTTGWQRVAGSVSRRLTEVDTIHGAPNWH
jgi:hypothetical protein